MEVENDVSGLHHHHQQELSSQTLESMLVCTKAAQDKKPRPPEEALKCPRCDSSNTKFCYYNNYSLTQPRYFCKSCRRYWTKGGTLRNVPVGGGCRKNKRSSSSSSATSSNSSSCSALSKRPQDHHLIQQHHHQQQHQLNLINSNSNNHLISGLPHLPYDSTCTDLSLAFARLQNQANGPIGFDQFDHPDHHDQAHDHLDHNGDQMGFLGFLENGNVLFHNGLYNGGNLGNGDMGSVGNLMGLNNVMNMNPNPNPSPNPNPNPNHSHNHNNNTMFSEHQDQEMMTCGAATTAVTMTTVKQEATGGGVLWGFPWQMGAGGGGGDQGMNMVHEVESGRSMIGGWNGIGSTNWHGLINSPLM